MPLMNGDDNNQVHCMYFQKNTTSQAKMKLTGYFNNKTKVQRCC